MRSEELTVQIVELLRQGMTQKEIAFQLGKHRNTVYKHVKRIRDSRIYSVNEIVNKIDNKLNTEINLMGHRDLIAYRRVLTPQPFEAKSEHKIIEEKRTVEITALLSNYEDAIRRAVNGNLKENSAK